MSAQGRHTERTRSLLAAVVGALTYALASNSKLAEIGRLVLFSGVLVTLWLASGRVAHL